MGLFCQAKNSLTQIVIYKQITVGKLLAYVPVKFI